jgi:Kdo2-lipid IVA lauroyltransferase/acyltransferase
MPAAICKRIPHAVMTYRALNNPHIDRRINKLRHDYGTGTAAPKGIGTRELMRALARGAPIALMNDQKFREGVAAPFFGHDAMTAQGPTRLALKYGVPIVPVSARPGSGWKSTNPSFPKIPATRRPTSSGP